MRTDKIPDNDIDNPIMLCKHYRALNMIKRKITQGFRGYSSVADSLVDIAQREVSNQNYRGRCVVITLPSDSLQLVSFCMALRFRFKNLSQSLTYLNKCNLI